MRVRISYSVDLDEVPEKSAALLEEAVAQLQVVTKLISDIAIEIKRNALKKEDLLLALDESRQIMGKVDSKLSDTTMIMTGFHDALDQIAKASSTEESILKDGEYGAD